MGEDSKRLKSTHTCGWNFLAGGSLCGERPTIRPGHRTPGAKERGVEVLDDEEWLRRSLAEGLAFPWQAIGYLIKASHGDPSRCAKALGQLHCPFAPVHH